MSDLIRQIYNYIDQLFDRRVISKEIKFSENNTSDTKRKTAFAAFGCIQPLVVRYDKKASLKMIVSQNGIDINGTSDHWEFFWALPMRRATVVCDWKLNWDNDKDLYSASTIEIAVKPFPPVDSPLNKLVADGKLLYRQLNGMWNQEYKQTPNLPPNFYDTDTAVKEFIKQGLNINETEFNLSTGMSPEGFPCWLALSKNNTYSSKFSK